MRLCISSLLQSSSPEYGLSFLYRLLSISRREYWLVKTEVCLDLNRSNPALA